MDFKTFQALPKAELHVHLEGAMRIQRIVEMAAEQPEHPWHGISAEDLAPRFQTASFPEFLEQFMAGYALPREARHFQAITEDLLADLGEQGVVAANILYSPGVYTQHLGVELKAIHDGIQAGIAQFPQLRVRFILDTVINLGFEFMSRTLEAVLADRREWIGGFSIGGGDPNLDMRPLLPLFHRASRAGLFNVAHVGEVDGPDNVAVLVRETDLLRVAHGYNAVKKPEVLDLLKNRGITVDISPTSGQRTGGAPDLADHPMKVFQDHGIPVTVNTDDPLYFVTDLYKEYKRVHDEMGFSEDQLKGFMQHSLTEFEKTAV
ncbi:MAG: hypothetical protein QNK37_37860 [Acidobacteriota bacterium]|nr:hypothetical protein [Acidobacteriota bacterium]